MDIITPFIGPEGINYTPYSPYRAGLCYFITSNCKNMDAAFALGDYHYDSDISTVVRFGEEGVDWTTDPAELAKTSNAYVDVGLYDGLTVAYKTNIWAEKNSTFWHNIGPRYASELQGNTVGNLVDPYDPTIHGVTFNAYNYEHYIPKHPDAVLPTLLYTPEEAKENAEIITVTTEYVKQSLAEFITGSRDVDKEWDSYVEELGKMDLEVWLTGAQAAFDRMAK